MLTLASLAAGPRRSALHAYDAMLDKALQPQKIKFNFATHVLQRNP